MDVDEPKSEANPSAGVPAPPAPANVPEPTPAAPVPTPQEAPSPAPAGVPDKPTVEKKAGGQGQRASIGQMHDSDWMLDTSGSVPQIKVVSTAAGNKRIPKKTLIRFEAVGKLIRSNTAPPDSIPLDLTETSIVVDVAKCLRCTAFTRQSVTPIIMLHVTGTIMKFTEEPTYCDAERDD